MEKRYKVEKYKTREEWLEARGIGGSDAAAILGVSPWATSMDVFKRLTIGDDGEEDNETFRYGRVMEPLIRQEFREDFSDEFEVIDPDGYELYRVIDKPYIHATIDGTLIEKETGRKGILEIKTHDVKNLDDAEQWKTGNLPTQYLAQLVHYLMVLNDYDFAVITIRLCEFAYDGEKRKRKSNTTVYFRIEREAVQAYIENTEKKEDYFWNNNVLKLVPPQPTIKF